MDPPFGKKTPQVILLGGAPKSGKSTLGRRLANHLDYDYINGDDLSAAARAVTMLDSHPDLHVMSGVDYRDYYLTRTADVLLNEAIRYLEACWPALNAVIEARATWGEPAVLEGWGLLPNRVVKLSLINVMAIWLLPEPGVFEDRIREKVTFHKNASDPARLVSQFAARSRLINKRFEKLTTTLGLAVLKPTANESEEITSAKLLDLVLGLQVGGVQR